MCSSCLSLFGVSFVTCVFVFVVGVCFLCVGCGRSLNVVVP